MATLRTFGLAGSSVEQSICEESQYLREAMEKEPGEQRPQNKKQTFTEYAVTEDFSPQESLLIPCPC